jgi:cyclic pyranopterin phosphate synthase
MSVDTLRPDVHHAITGINDLDDVLDALRSCAATAPLCKVNVVVMRGVNDQEIWPLIEHCAMVGVSTVKLLDVIHDLDHGTESYGKRLEKLGVTKLEDLYLPLDTIVSDLRREAIFEQVVTQGGLGHPMTSFLMPAGIEVLVKDHHLGAWYGDVCGGCPHFPCHDALMAIRLTSDLRIQFCLLREDIAFSLADCVADRQRLAARLTNALGTYETAEFHREGTWLATS